MKSLDDKIKLYDCNAFYLTPIDPVTKLILDQYLNYEYVSVKLDYKKKRKGITEYIREKVNGVFYDITPEGFYKFSHGFYKYLPDDLFIIEDAKSFSNDELPFIDKTGIKDILINYELRNDQVDAVVNCINYRKGIIQAPTGSGKSIIIAALLKKLLKMYDDINILVLCPSVLLKNNIYDYIKSECILTTNSQSITVSTALPKWVQDPNNVKTYDAILIDECHHASSDSYQNILLNAINAKYILGFSAEAIDMNRYDKNKINELTYSEGSLVGTIGPIISEKVAADYVEAGILAVPIFISVKYDAPELYDNFTWTSAVECINSYDRMEVVSVIAHILSRESLKSLILVKEKIPGIELAQLIIRLNPNEKVGVVYGGGVGMIFHSGGVDELNSTEVLDKLDAGEFNIIIGSSVMDEGVDINKLDAVVMTAAGKSSRRSIQRIGRALRKSKNSSYAYIIDICDNGNRLLHTQYLKRLNVIRNQIGIPRDRQFCNISLAKFDNVLSQLVKL